MYKVLLLNIISLFPYLTSNLIFLEKPAATHTVTNNFNLNKEDIRYIRYFFKKKNNTLLNFDSLPKTSRKNVASFFAILKNPNNKNYIKAYLFLLNIVPEVLIEDEIGC